MKIRFLILFLSISSFCFSQIIIRGTVYDKNGVLEGAAVYSNNTMIGTTTNKKGEFSITVKEGQHQLIVSYLGYKTLSYALNTTTHSTSLTFTLIEETNLLDEIIIKKIVYDNAWKSNLKRFKKEFIGSTALAKECKILNPEVIFFEFDAKENILTAISRKPLKIMHKGLGYFITYDLISFRINNNYVSYTGYSKYKQLKGNKRQQIRWKKNRLKAYNGSTVHFFKAAIQNKILQEGFLVNQFKRVPNPERPSEDEIKKARKLVWFSGTKINFSKKIDQPKNAIDSAIAILKKVKLPKFKNYVYKTIVPQSEIISIKNTIPYIDFDDNLSVIYSKRKRIVSRKPIKVSYQTSSIILVKRPSKISENGTLYNPLDVYYDGYWSNQKFANSLPLDYEPEKK